MKTTKVKQTEIYKDSQGEHIVCKGKLILIDSMIKEKNSFDTINGFKQAIIISETEEIEVGEKMFHLKGGFYVGDIWNNYPNIMTAESFWYSIMPGNKTKVHKFSKVLAMPENFSSKHLQAIIDGKLNDGDEVYIECFPKIEHRTHIGTLYDTSEPMIKLTSNYIKLFPVKKEESWNDIITLWNQDTNHEDVFSFLIDNYNSPTKK